MFRLLTALLLTVMFLGRAEASLICMTDTGVSVTEHGCEPEAGTHLTRAIAASEVCDSCIDVVVSSDSRSSSASRDLRPLVAFQAVLAVIFEMLPPLFRSEPVSIAGNWETVPAGGSFFTPLSTIILRM